jgi:hypothetical protein
MEEVICENMLLVFTRVHLDCWQRKTTCFAQCKVCVGVLVAVAVVTTDTMNKAVNVGTVIRRVCSSAPSRLREMVTNGGAHLDT